jgi:hypothetical protein
MGRMSGPIGGARQVALPVYNRATEAIGLHYARCAEV